MLGGHPDWPINVKKPKLPVEYEWVCLRPALGIGEEGAHPFYVRVRQTRKRGRLLITKLPYYETPQDAINGALEAVVRNINTGKIKW